MSFPSSALILELSDSRVVSMLRLSRDFFWKDLDTEDIS